MGPTGATGAIGPQGIPGPLNIPTLYVFSSNEDVPDEGLQIESDYRLPLEVEMTDNTNSFYVSNVNNTITFLKKGVYRVDFIAYAHTIDQVSALEAANIISIGFRKIEESTVYAGGTIWGNSKIPTAVIGHGIVNIAYPNQLYELVNLGKYPIFLQSPKLSSLNTDSSFANPIVTVIIQAIS